MLSLFRLFLVCLAVSIEVRAETTSAIRITRFNTTGLLTWTNLQGAGGVYAVERAPALAQPWSELPGFSAVTSTTPEVTVTVPLSPATNAFFRVVLKGSQEPVLADSFLDYSGVQGERGWFYGYYDTNQVFTLLPHYGPWVNGQGVTSTNWNLDGTGSWLLIDATSCHPEGTNCGRLDVSLPAVRRWVSPVQSPVQIASTVSGGNGVIASIIVDGVLAAAADLPSAGGQTNFTVAANLDIGSIVDCVLDSRNENECFDYTQFRITIRP